MSARTAELSDFGEFLQVLCARSEVSAYDVGHAAGVRTNSRITYAMRRRHSKSRSTLLSWQELWRIAHSEQLMATEDERRRLLILGLKEHASPGLHAYIHWLEARVADYERKGKTVIRRPSLQPPEELSS